MLGPVEIKTTDPNLFRTVHSLQDLWGQAWIRRYVGQLTLYELASNCERGWFLLVNKATLL